MVVAVTRPFQTLCCLIVTLRMFFEVNTSKFVSLTASDSGREVEELTFTGSNLEIGGQPALDYFNDGSLYLIDMPGVCHSCFPPCTPS